jgi:hypothetical protein
MTQTRLASHEQRDQRALSETRACCFRHRLIYPLGFNGGEGSYYLQMICGVDGVLGVFLITAAGTRLKTAA